MIQDLGFRSVRAARSIYSAIGARLGVPGFDPFTMRAVVPSWFKLLLLGKAALSTLGELPARMRRARPHAALTTVARFPDDILPV